LVNYWDNYTEMHGQQNVKICDDWCLGPCVGGGDNGDHAEDGYIIKKKKNWTILPFGLRYSTVWYIRGHCH